MEQEIKQDEVLHSWKITTHEERERTGRFYVIFFIVFVLLILFAVWQKSFLFGMFLLLAGGTILFLSGQRAEVFEFTFTDSHFIIGDHPSTMGSGSNGENKYEYASVSHYDLYSFSETDRELFVVFKEKLRPLLRVRYYKGDEQKIEDILASKNIPRKKIEPSLLDIFSKVVGI